MRTKNLDLMEQILKFIDNSYSINGRSPTIREIASSLQISVGCVANYITEMTNRKMLVNNGGSRGIMTMKMAKTNYSVSNLPVVGSIACGSPLLAEENIECYLPIPKEFLGNGGTIHSTSWIYSNKYTYNRNNRYSSNKGMERQQ